MRPALIHLATKATQQPLDVKCAICGASGQELTTCESTQYFICKARQACIHRLQFLVSVYPEGVVNLTFGGIPLAGIFYLNYLYTHRLQYHPTPRDFIPSNTSSGYLWAKYYRSFDVNAN